MRGTRVQERSEKTRIRLVCAGAELFDRKGYANATLLDIADAAGVTKGALYFHFSSKEDLANAVRQRGQSLVGSVVQRAADGGRSPLQALVDFTHWLARTLHEDAALRAAFRISSERAGSRPAPGTGFHETCIAAGRQLLREARAAGELRPGGQDDGPETLIAAALCGIEVLSRCGMAYGELSARIGALWDLMLPRLVPAGAAGRYRTGPPAKDPATGGCGMREPATGGRPH
ncbi:ScbR family autoregulator-binding transcription factor [Streptomyces sp. 4N124]|uniref:ScbR family autoregulator-binding transcription factor n=1 Tax=Streptomyces sp. 4N124 TaxID=3457420 RepID=UPI003FD152A3